MFFFQPLEQFEINILVSFLKCILLTNYHFLLLIIFIVLFIVFYLSISKASFMPNNWQYLNESIFRFFIDFFMQQLNRHGQAFLPLIYSVFLFILLSNVIGLIPFSFTVTSHISTTFSLSCSLFLGLTLFGLILQKFHFFYLFLPSGVPALLLPFLVIIEVISYLARVFSLAIRLFANMMSGHTLLNILSTFIFQLFSSYSFLIKFLSLFPFFLVFVICILEIGISILQAYVFAVLLCIYLNDMYNVSH